MDVRGTLYTVRCGWPTCSPWEERVRAKGPVAALIAVLEGRDDVSAHRVEWVAPDGREWRYDHNRRAAASACGWA